jgi:hypothetical protein
MDLHSDSKNDIVNMRKALDMLCNTHVESYEYNQIIVSILNYLKNNCKHSLIIDNIDTDYGEKSVCICYCKICLLDESQILNGTDLTITSDCVSTTCI